MVLRIVRFELSDRVEPAFMQHMRELAERSIQEVEGLVELRLVRSHEGDSVVVLGMSLWRDYGSMHAFFGDELDRPLLVDPYGEWADSAEVTHYEEVVTVRSGVGDGVS